MKNHRVGLHLEKNALSDQGDGLVVFPNGQVITDETTQRNGTRYDIASMDISEYKGQVTADHVDSVQTLIGRVTETVKEGRQVLIKGIQFAVKENALARLAYDLMRGGYLTDLSIETYGPMPDEEDVYYNAKLIGLSAVVVGNNRSATLNQIAVNSLEQAKKDGLDTSEVEQLLQSDSGTDRVVAAINELRDVVAEASERGSIVSNKEQDMKLVKIKNGRGFAVKVTYKNAAGETVETELADGETVEVPESEKDAVETQLDGAEVPVEDKEEKKDEEARPDLTEAIAEAIKAATEPLAAQMAELKKDAKEAFNKSASEPAFRKDNNGAVRPGSQLEAMPWRDRTALQLQKLHQSLKGDRSATEVVQAINELHLEQLKKSGKAANALTLTDIGNFVIPPEMVTEIAGLTSNYRPLLDQFKFQETMSLQTSWIERTGEISMTDVEMEEDGANGDLKPISEPTYTTHTTNLKEFAAVTPVDSSAIRFAAADIVQDISTMYRRAYDRALAQSVIGRLEKAVEANGNSVTYNFSSGNGGNVGSLVALIRAWAEVAEHTPNGVYIMTMASYLHLFEQALRAGTNGPLANIFTQGPDGIPRFLGLPYVVVPSDLMPDLNTASTKSWTFEEVSVTVNHGVLFADPSNFKGRVSGGLNFQVSTEAAYEQGGSVKSAFQRDKVVFRGYGYRASAMTETSQVAGVLSPGIS